MRRAIDLRDSTAQWRDESEKPTVSGGYVLALDIASSCGWALADAKGKIVDSGTVVLEGDDQQKLAALLSWLYGRVKDVETVVVEAPLPPKAASNRLPIALWGVAVAVAVVSGCEFHEIHNATIKKAVTGNGKADKAYVRKSVERQTGIVAKTDDEADAIGIALAWRQRKAVRGVV